MDWQGGKGQGGRVRDGGRDRPGHEAALDDQNAPGPSVSLCLHVSCELRRCREVRASTHAGLGRTPPPRRSCPPTTTLCSRCGSWRAAAAGGHPAAGGEGPACVRCEVRAAVLEWPPADAQMQP